MLEIDVDIGRLVARLAHKPFEHHRADLGADLRHPQRIAGHRIGRAAPALAQNPPPPGKGHHVMHGQEIGLVFQLGDQCQFMLQHRLRPLRRPAGIAGLKPLHRQPPQPRRRRLALRHLRRVFIAQLVERKRQSVGQRPGPVHRRLVTPVKPQHFDFRAQPPLGIGQRRPAQHIDPRLQPDRRHHIGQPPPTPPMHQRHARGDGFQPQLFRQPFKPHEPRLVLPVITGLQHQVHPLAVSPHQPYRLSAPALAPVGMQQKFQPRVMLGQITQMQDAGPLLGPQPPLGQKPAEARPALPVARQRRHPDPFGKFQPRRRDQPRQHRHLRPRTALRRRRPDQTVLRLDLRPLRHLGRHRPRRRMRPHDPRDRVHIRNRQRLQPQPGRLVHVFLRVRRPGQEGKVRYGAKLGEHG